jgi:Fe-S-cluster containining protein
MKLDYPHGTRFKCTRCGLCCGDTPYKTRHVLMLRTEAEKISDATKQPIDRFTVEVEDKVPYVYEMAKTKAGTCVFLKENQCTIYTLRPLVCRFYPFELKTNETGTPQFAATDECPGIGKGRVMAEQDFRRLFRLARGRVKGERRLSETRGED